jgi:hypothetical protein
MLRECNLIEYYFNSHNNRMFNEFSEPVGPITCMANSEDELCGAVIVPDECPILTNFSKPHRFKNESKGKTEK